MLTINKSAARKALVFPLGCIAVLAITQAQAETKPKYGPDATVLRKSHEYVQKNPAPDFWALMPYYAAQQGGSACSVSSVTMVINAARSEQNLTADDQLATQTSVLKKTGDDDWTKAMSDGGRGRTLDQIGPLTEKAFKAHGFVDAKAEVIHVNDLSAATQAQIHKALVENEKSTDDFIIANYIQGVYTGDADVGHVAPVAAYDAKTKRVLILDPDREWYEPYWVSEEVFLKGLNTQDKMADGKFRGIVWVRKGAAKK